MSISGGWRFCAALRLSLSPMIAEELAYDLNFWMESGGRLFVSNEDISMLSDFLLEI